MKKIRLFWWNSKPNIGDYASYYIVSHLFNGEVVHKLPYLSVKRLLKQTLLFLIRKGPCPQYKEYLFPWNNILFGVGSILDFATKNSIIWGSGFREPYSKTKANRFVLVRGKLSRDKIGDPTLPIGDPALILPRIYMPKVKKSKNHIVIIPHFNDYDYFFSNYGSLFTILKIESNNIEHFIDEIANSDYVLSTSLHGLIISHAYGVPALWIKKGYIDSSDFKFKDYFSSVGINYYKPFEDIEELLSDKRRILTLFDEYKKHSSINVNLQIIQNNIINSFPY